MKKKAIYAGTFDPITYGHLDILARATQIFDQVLLAIAASSKKRTLFDPEERIALARAATAHFPQVEVVGFDRLLVDFAREHQIHVLVRGIRSAFEFDYEKKLAAINKQLFPQIETVFFMSSEPLSFVSSSLVKEIAEYGGEIKNFVPDVVHSAILRKQQQRK